MYCEKQNISIMNFKNSIILFFNLISLSLYAQTGSISGLVKDANDGVTIPGVHVVLNQGLKQLRTDLDGNFIFSNLPDGIYTLTLKYPEYKTFTQDSILLKNGEAIIQNIEMNLNVNDVKMVTVSHTVDKSGVSGLISEQKSNASVSDGISSDDMKTKPDSKASESMKRISGASVQDNKFIVIRGLNDRYNFAMINGAPLPSSESDRKAFSFDIFPSNMLDNMVILKTATPDLPGEFAGGVININTSKPKTENFQNIQIGTSYNTLSTFKNFKTYKGDSKDFLGLGKGSRAIPSAIPSTVDMENLNIHEKATLAQSMTPSWALQNKMALPALNIQYGLGRNFNVKKRDLGMVFAVSYSNSSTAKKSTRREFEEQADKVVLRSELNDSIYTQSILASSLLNFEYKLNQNNKLVFNNLFSISTDDQVSVRKGAREMDQVEKQWEKSSNRWYTENLLYTTQLGGEHSLSKSKLKFNWTGGYSNVNRTIPNMRRVVYQKTSEFEDDENARYFAVIQNNGTIPTAAGNMFWSETKEQIYSAKYDLILPVEFKKSKHEFKIGGMNQFRNRDFSARNFGFSKYKPTGSAFNSELLALPEDQIFAAENLGTLADGRGGFKLDEATKVSDSYQASSILHAGYAMFDSKFFTEKLRFVGGVRLESYQQKFNYIEAGTNVARNIDTTVVDLLPSLNAIYSITKKMNVRASYYKTVSRPEFRELAPFAFYNFAMDNILSGNPNLKRAVINNFDLRYEVYPGNAQLFSVSAFYKDFTNPIELINRPGTSGASELYYTNITKATNYGVEFEYRVKLDIFSKNKEHKLLSNTTFFTNFSAIKSSVKLDQIIGSGGNRSLQGQSPYIVNAGFQFVHPTKEWTTSISYNTIGNRIYIVGNEQEPSVWERGRNVLDLQFTKTFKEKIQVKLNVKDLFAQKAIFFQDLDNNKKYNAKVDNTWQEVKFGQTVSLSVSYKF